MPGGSAQKGKTPMVWTVEQTRGVDTVLWRDWGQQEGDQLVDLGKRGQGCAGRLGSEGIR